MNFSEVCNNLIIPNVVGPFEVFASLGHWNTSVLIILALHLLPVWGAALSLHCRLSSTQFSSLIPTCACLLSLPPALMTLATVGILVPSLGVFVEILHEIVISLGLVKFVRLCLILSDGEKSIVNFCNERNIKLPIGSPPFVCLLPLSQPKISSRNLKLMVAAPKLLFLYKSLILLIEVINSVLGYESRGGFFILDNLHNIIGIPIGLITIYFYTMFNFVMIKVLGGKSKRFIGVILLLEFVLFDCTRLFFIFLTGTGMLQCVPPFLSQKLVEHLMKNYIKAFLATGIGLAMMNLVAEVETEKIKENSAHVSHSSLISCYDNEKKAENPDKNSS